MGRPLHHWVAPAPAGDQYIPKAFVSWQILGKEVNFMKFWKRVKKCRAVLAASGLMSVVFASPAFAADAGGGMTSLLASFTQVAAWMWSEIGLLLTWILNQPILLLAMSLFFVGAIVSFFIRVFHSV